LNDEVYACVKPSAVVTPTLYGIPTFHKSGIPCRPILASTGNFTNDYAVWLNEVLAPIYEHSTNLKDDFEFITKLEQSQISNSNIMVSFDVKSLFTNFATNI